MGKKTSVYLSDQLSDQMKASGHKHADVLTAGLAALRAAASAEQVTRADVREEVRGELAPVLERLDAKPDTDEVRRLVREEVARAAGQAY